MPYADPERQREYDRQKYRRRLAIDPEGTREAQRLRVKRWHEQNPDAQRGFTLKHRYGISLEVYNAMLEQQGGVCAICGEKCRTGESLAVDHHHETGVVRGLLCRACNGAIGALGDDPEIIRAALRYLEES
jgi:hypothetical protein